MTYLLFCNLPPPYTGQTVITSTIAQGLMDRHRHIETINTTPHAAPFCNPSRARKFLVFLRALAILVYKLSRLRPRVLYIVASADRDGHYRDLIVTTVARLFRIPVVAHVHNGNFADRSESTTGRLLTRNTNAFIFSSPGLARRSPSIPLTKKSAVFNPVDKVAEIPPRNIKPVHDQDPLRILYLSNMIKSKGYLDLLEACKEASKYKAIQATFIGAWPTDAAREEFHVRVERAGLTEVVRLLPPPQSGDWLSDRYVIREILIDHHVFALPTYYPFEAQPVSINEAMSASLAIIATCHASIPEYIKSGHNGILVKPRSPSQLATAILALANDPPTLHRMRLNARATYDTQFARDHLLDRIDDIITATARTDR